MGPVFRAYDPESDRLVAIKRFQLDLPPDRVHRFVAELDRIVDARLKEPCVQSIAAGIADVSAWLAQEFVAAESLDVLLRDRQRMSPPEVLRIVSGIANALEAAAAVGIEHGALHPRDVLVSSELVRLTGLGVARALEVAGGVSPSRRPYAAPERNEGLEWDRRADVFSLASLAHEMLWARRATEVGEAAAEALTEVDGTNVTAMRRLFASALAERADDRPENAAAFADGLRQACTVTARAPRQFVRRERRSRSGASAALAEVPRLIEFEPRLPLDEPAIVDPVPDLEPAAVAGPVAAVDPVAAVEAAAAPAPESVLELAGDAEAERAPAAAPTLVRRTRRERLVRESPRPAAAALPLAHERSSIGWLPVALTAIIFLAVGFAAGYATATLKAPAAADNESQDDVPAASLGADIALPGPPAREPVASSTPAAPAATATTTSTPARPAASSRPAEGRLVIRSTPAGARVVVDGRERGRTPLTLSQLSLGPHTIRVMRDGYESGERRLVLTAGRSSQTATFTLAVARAPQARAAQAAPASVRFETRPAGASVMLDGRLVGKTPLELRNVAAGEHAVRFELDGYSRWTTTLRVEAGRPERVAASLDPVSARD